MNEEMAFYEDEKIETDESQPAEIVELKDEISALQSRIKMLVEENAELISDNLALRAKAEALLNAKAALPEFSVRTEFTSDKYGSIREAFKKR